jgi:hypothetical protein
MEDTSPGGQKKTKGKGGGVEVIEELEVGGFRCPFSIFLLDV